MAECVTEIEGVKKKKVYALVVVYLLGYSELRLPWSSIDASHLGDPHEEVIRNIESDPPAVARL